MKHIPTIGHLSVEKVGKRNEYGEQTVIIKAAGFTGTVSPTNSAPFDYHPNLAEVTFGYNEEEREANAAEIVRRCNNFKNLKETIEAAYLDYFNNFLSLERFAEHYGLEQSEANYIINAGRRINHRTNN